MGYRVRIHVELFPHVDFEYVFLELTKNSKPGVEMVGTDPIWSAPLKISPRAPPWDEEVPHCRLFLPPHAKG